MCNVKVGTHSVIGNVFVSYFCDRIRSGGENITQRLIIVPLLYRPNLRVPGVKYYIRVKLSSTQASF